MFWGRLDSRRIFVNSVFVFDLMVIVREQFTFTGLLPLYKKRLSVLEHGFVNSIFLIFVCIHRLNNNNNKKPVQLYHTSRLL